MPASRNLRPSGRRGRQEVTSYPHESINRDSFVIAVEYCGNGRWAVRRGSRRCLSTSGTWEWESIPSERTAEWLNQHRFNLEAALDLAKKFAPTLTLGGSSIAEVVAFEEANNAAGS